MKSLRDPVTTGTIKCVVTAWLLLQKRSKALGTKSRSTSSQYYAKTRIWPTQRITSMKLDDLKRQSNTWSGTSKNFVFDTHVSSDGPKFGSTTSECLWSKKPKTAVLSPVCTKISRKQMQKGCGTIFWKSSFPRALLTRIYRRDSSFSSVWSSFIKSIPKELVRWSSYHTGFASSKTLKRNDAIFWSCSSSL